jgi:hypothetical protein
MRSPHHDASYPALTVGVIAGLWRRDVHGHDVERRNLFAPEPSAQADFDAKLDAL